MTRIQLKERGGILLGKNVSCDGFSCEHPIRVQTHIHSDHMSEFDTSKANQTIVMSCETRDLLVSIYNADLPYRSNIITLKPGEKFPINGDVLELVPSNHMLGSVQVKVTSADGYRMGYSSDFFWPVDEVVQVDELIVDSTYGDPLRVRQYTQNHVSEKLTEVVCSRLSLESGVALIGHNGRLQNSLYLISDFIRSQVIASPKAYPLFDSYRRSGYHIPNVIRSDSSEGILLLKERAPVVALVTLNERRHLPWVDRFKKVQITGFMSRPQDPVTYYDNGDCCIALTDHADFLGTMEYVRASGAKLVWTDPRSGNAEALADAISRQLGLTSSVIPHLHSLGWG
jgi:putative mRNA 3-end processing factor